MFLWHKWFRRCLRVVLPSARSLRMATYATFAFGGLTLAASRSVYADVREMGLDVGHQLAKLEDLTGGAHLIRVNGAELHRASAHTTLSTDQVLDRYETVCRESPGAIGRAMNDIPTALADRIDREAGPKVRTSVLRSGSDGRGMVVCFVDDPSMPAAPFTDRMRALAETSDLSQLGHFRYVFAEPSKGPQGGTHVITFWSDGELNLEKMFPATGDAPGTDSPLAPRPAGSRRTLAASVEGYPASVRIYESLAARDSIQRMYDETLHARGFTKVDAPDAHDAHARGGAAYIRNDNAEIFVSFTVVEKRTTVTIVEAAPSPSIGVQAEVK